LVVVGKAKKSIASYQSFCFGIIDEFGKKPGKRPKLFIVGYQTLISNG
jgi:hypothetical protein